MRDRMLRAYLAGALDPGRAAEVEETLAASPALQRRLSTLLTAEVSAPGTSGWGLPPAGVRGPWSLPVEVHAAPFMDGEGVVAWHTLLLDIPDDQLPRMVVVVQRPPGGDWAVWLPTAPDEVIHGADLPLQDARRRLDVASIDGELAVVLLPEDVAPRWDAEDPWAEARHAVRTGRAPMTVLRPVTRGP
jgi:hypothetical protein